MPGPRYIPFISHAMLHVLLEPARAGKLLQIVDVKRQIETGTETLVLTCKAGDRVETFEYHGATYVGVSTPDLRVEQQRIRLLREALDEIEKSLAQVLAMRGADD